jgi:hypothetical protein
MQHSSVAARTKAKVVMDRLMIEAQCSEEEHEFCGYRKVPIAVVKQHQASREPGDWVEAFA